MNYFKSFIFVFLSIFLLYLLTVILNKKKRRKILETNQAKLIAALGNFDVNSVSSTSLVWVISIANSFIVALTFTISEFFRGYVIKLLLSFVVVIILIFVVYKIVGIFYKKKEGK